MLLQFKNLKNSMDIAILTALETGLRQGEIVALAWGDINLEKKNISVTKSLSIMKSRDSGEDNNYKKVIKPPKTRSSIRTVPISSALSSDLKAFKDYLDENNYPTGKNDIVFPSSFGNHLHPANLSHRLNEITKKAGLPNLSFHKLRHTFITRLIENGVNLSVVQKYAGHSTPLITLGIYNHITPESLEEGRSCIDKIYAREGTVVGY